MCWLTNLAYPIEQEMADAKASIEKFNQGDENLSNFYWVLKITARDLIVSLVTPLLWQILFYNSAYAATLRAVKFNKDYPAAKHIWREIPYSISTVVMGTFIEAFLMSLYATGRLTNYYMDISEHPFAFFGMLLTLPIWRNGHFYWVHRFEHQWNTTWVPDFGKWMYENVHSLHHQSRNFQPWSGIAMHPVEGFMYETACMLPCLFFHHPIMINITKIEENLGAILGHDGFDFPGNGDWYHLIHHMKINCNYGNTMAPYDYLFGTLVDEGDGAEVSDQTERYEKEML